MKKYKLKIISLILILLLLVPGSVVAIASIGHFDDTAWNGLSAGYNDISVDITIETWNGGQDAYYYSNNAYLTSGKNIYGGLQTNGYDGTKWVGKMAIFSIWDTTSGIADPGGTATPFGGEGVGYSVRMPYNWETGTPYRFKMYIDQDASTGNRLWGGSVTNLRTGAVTRIGRIYAPVSYGKIMNPVTFHERYIGGTSSCGEMSPSQVRFSNMTANSGSVNNTGTNHYVKKELPECPGLIWLNDVASGYVSGIATTKSAQQPPVQKTPTQAAPAATPSSTPTPTSTTATIPVTAPEATQPVATKTVEPQKNTKPAKKLSATIIIISSVVMVGLLITATTVLIWLRTMKRRRLLAHHFPYDYDIHGTQRLVH